MSFRLLWLPSRIRLSGNETADMATKAALHSCYEVEVVYAVSQIEGLAMRHVMSNGISQLMADVKKRVSREMTSFGNTQGDQVIYISNTGWDSAI